jgi:exopolysaccharide biosynthesis polyprenyl glycosylphosphotransferase
VPVRRVFLLTALKLFDLASVVVCYAVAWMVVVAHAQVTSAGDLLSLEISVADLMLSLGLLAVWHLVFLVLSVYRSKRLSSRWSEIGGIVRATAAGCAVVYLPSLLVGTAPVQNLLLGLVFFAAMCTVTVTSRLALRWVLGVVRRHGRNLRDILIVGTNRRALAFARKLQESPELGYRILGFVDSREWDVSGEFERSGHPLVGGVGDPPALLRRQVVDEVLVFLPLKSFYDLGARVVGQCEEQGIRVTLPSSSMFELTKAQAMAEELEADPVVTIATRTITGAGAVLKRVIDVVGAAVLLVALAPLLLGVALVIKLTSPGPVLFSQERVGLKKRRFRMLKFRTMVADAERRMREVEHLNEVSGPVFKIRNDPRVTRVGAVLRKTSIDELPQLLNVLKGDLSLVGPRPLPVRDYEGFDKDPHRRRFSVRPGITCLWQIGGRSNVSFERWMELDMEYIDNWSLWLDLKILIKTIPVVLRGTGAA